MGQATAAVGTALLSVLGQVNSAVNGVLSKRGTRIEKKIDAVKLHKEP